MKKWLLFFISLISAKTAIAFVLFKNEDGEPLRWHLDDLNPLVHTDVVNRKTKAIKFHLSRDGWSEKNFENELNSIRSAAAQWEAVPGTVLKFEEGNLLEPGVDINGNDNQNVIYWVKEATPNGAVLVNNERTDISGALAVTFPTYFDDHTIVEADMVFNGVTQRWFTDYTNTFSNDNLVEAIALHEFGHFIGPELNTPPLLWRFGRFAFAFTGVVRIFVKQNDSKPKLIWSSYFWLCLSTFHFLNVS